MEAMVWCAWMFGGMFLVFSVCCGAYGCALWRKVTLIHRSLAVCRDEARAQKLHKVGVKYTKEFKEMRWCFFFSLDFVMIFVIFLAKTKGYAW